MLNDAMQNLSFYSKQKSNLIRLELDTWKNIVENIMEVHSTSGTTLIGQAIEKANFYYRKCMYNIYCRMSDTSWTEIFTNFNNKELKSFSEVNHKVHNIAKSILQQRKPAVTLITPLEQPQQNSLRNSSKTNVKGQEKPKQKN